MDYIIYIRKIIEILSEEEHTSFDTLCKKVDKLLFKVSFFYEKATYMLLNLDFVERIDPKNKTDDEILESVLKQFNTVSKYMQNDIFPENIWNGSLMFNNVNEKIYFGQFSQKDLLIDSFYNNKISKRVNKKVKLSLLRCTLNTTGEFLYKMQYLHHFNDIFNHKLKNNFIADMAIDVGEFKGDFFIQNLDPDFTASFFRTEPLKNENFTLIQNFQVNYLNTLNQNELIILNSFWANKIAKICGKFIKILYILSQNFEILKSQDIEKISNFIDSKMDDNETKNIFFQLKKLYLNQNVNNNETLKCLLPIYKKYANAYFFKSFSLFSFLQNIESGEIKFLKNYGFIKENNSHMLIFLCDYPGYILPFSFHMPCEQIKIFYNKKSKLRKYIGADDLFSGKFPLTAPIIYPIPKGKISYLKEKSRINNRLAHLYFIQTGKWPEHLKNENGKVPKEFLDISDL